MRRSPARRGVVVGNQDPDRHRSVLGGDPEQDLRAAFRRATYTQPRRDPEGPLAHPPETPRPPADPVPPPAPPQTRLLVLAIVSFAFLMEQVDSTVLATALPAIAADGSTMSSGQNRVTSLNISITPKGNATRPRLATEYARMPPRRRAASRPRAG